MASWIRGVNAGNDFFCDPLSLPVRSCVMRTMRIGYCHECERNRRLEHHGTNHVLHLLATFLLCGMWIPFWLIYAWLESVWRCDYCGSRQVDKIPIEDYE